MKFMSTVVVAIPTAWVFQGCKTSVDVPDSVDKSSDDLNGVAAKYEKAARGSSVQECKNVDSIAETTYDKMLHREYTVDDNLSQEQKQKKRDKIVSAFAAFLKKREDCYKAYNQSPPTSAEDIVKAIVNIESHLTPKQKSKVERLIMEAYYKA